MARSDTRMNATRIGAIAAAELETTSGERLRGFLHDLARALREINLTGLAAQVAYSPVSYTHLTLPTILLV